MLGALLVSVLLTTPDCPKQTVFPGVVVESSFAHDRGCAPSRYKVDGKEYTDFNALLPAFKKAGWDDLKNREFIALTWEKAMCDNPLEDGKAKLQPDGSVLVEGKVKPRPSMRGPTPEGYREPVKVKYAPDGTVSYPHD